MTKLEKSMVESMGLTEDNFNKPKVTEIDRIKANENQHLPLSCLSR